MKAYVTFCGKQLDSAALLQKLTENSTAFRDLVKKCQNNVATKGMPLSSFLIKPMQRITRYPLLINKILENTPDDHPDYKNLQEALTLAESFLNSINENVRLKENQDRLNWLQQCVQNDLNIVFNSETNKLGPRQLLHYGIFNKLKSNKELLGFLFNDFFMFVQATKSIGVQFTFQINENVSYKLYKQPILIQNLMVSRDSSDNIESGTDSNRVLNIQDDKNTYKIALLVHTVSECGLWMKRIESAKEMCSKMYTLNLQNKRKTHADACSSSSMSCTTSALTQVQVIPCSSQEEVDEELVSGHVPKTFEQSIWLPDFFDIVLLPKQPYVYPSSEGKKQKRKFQENWVTDPTLGFAFLGYSKKEDAVYCKPCFLFFNTGVGKGGHEAPGKLVSSGFRDWKKAKETFMKHSMTDYHKACVVSAEQFMMVMSGKQKDVHSQLHTQHAREREENRSALRPIIETILFCAEQELPLRGDEDSGPLTLEKPDKKDGKFRALLRFRACAGDENLKRHIINCGKNATYVSPEIQNEIIQTCSNLVTQEIVSRIQKSDCFAILADETMDISATEQLSICIRYVDYKNETPVIREDFVGFVPIYSQSAEHITKVILEKCNNLNLNLNKCVGQGYDGVATMSGHLTGVQTRIREKYPKARYFHCASHRLNLVLGDTFSNSCVRNCLGAIKEITNFFRNSTHANNILQHNINIHAADSKKKRLTRLCETRFVERHNSVLTFAELLHPIVVSLEEISQTPQKISSSAASFLATVGKSDFIVSLFVCEKLFSLTLPLSVSLQEKNLDMVSTINHAETLLESLKSMRNNAMNDFRDMFTSAETLSREIFECPLAIPRLISRQPHRSNPETNSIKDYFRVTMYIPCVDSLIQNLTERFLANEDILSSFQILLPGFTSPEKVNLLENLTQYFEGNLSLAAVKAEYILWCNSTKGELKKETEVLKVLELCDKTYYRTIHYLLTVLATMPVTTCSVERTFSTMKRVKSVHRSLMSDKKLSALVMVATHRDINIKPDHIIDKMAGAKKRRLLL
ncbi:unnamed protein product [Diabrotica balteata]|uniref:DH domain-containing protein n=1 Tax=Diabrotica balteata TaxID=107213 RepID=A0A9N9SVI3_DIABA|nr:unnamed protein product [Diabrotica balteata]